MSERPYSSKNAKKAPIDIGRPSKFTPERRSAIIDAISHRIPYEFAAEANGICEATLYEWIRTGHVHQAENNDSEYARFSQDIKKAESLKIRHHMDIIAERPERWQADAWLLERRWPKHYGANSQVNELNERLSKLERGEAKDGQDS